MSLTINVIEVYTDIMECRMAEVIRHVALEDDHKGAISTCVMYGWLSRKAEVIKEVQPY